MSLTSIIITTHNRPKLLRRAVESAFAAGTNLEVIVVDDASTDETATVCRDLTGIKYVRVERNQRVAGARNLGLLASSGQYITFLDDDDVRLPGSLDAQIKLLETNSEAGLIYGQAVLVDQSGTPTNQSYPRICHQGDVLWELLGQNFIPCGTAVFRRSCLDRVGLLDQSLAGIDDWDLWIRIAELCSIMALPEPVMYWRQSTPASQQGTSAASRIVLQSVEQFQESWKNLPRVSSASREMKRRAWRRFSANMSAHLSFEVLRALRHRQLVPATKNLFALLRLIPAARLRWLRINNAHSSM
jgi:glycosyltransferase involved in cell wall biosynthesis